MNNTYGYVWFDLITWYKEQVEDYTVELKNIFDKVPPELREKICEKLIELGVKYDD